MKIKVVSKSFGSQVIDTDNYDPIQASASSTLFQVIEFIFDSWFAHYTQPGAPMGKDILGMYNGEIGQPAIYSSHAAICEGISNFIETVLECGKPSVFVTTADIMKMDIEASFV